MIARCAELLGDPLAVLSDAAFSEITEMGVVACAPEVAANWSFSAVGRVSFLVGAETRRYVLLKTRSAVDRLDCDMGIDYMVTKGDFPFDGSATFSGVSDLEGALNVIVQTVKSLHAMTEPEAADIWFTGIRKFALPTDWSVKMSGGRVHVKCLRRMNVGNQTQTMLDVSLSFDRRADTLSGMVTFAFNMPEPN